jgi:hypothetical protein
MVYLLGILRIGHDRLAGVVGVADLDVAVICGRCWPESVVLVGVDVHRLFVGKGVVVLLWVVLRVRGWRHGFLGFG